MATTKIPGNVSDAYRTARLATGPSAGLWRRFYALCRQAGLDVTEVAAALQHIKQAPEGPRNALTA